MCVLGGVKQLPTHGSINNSRINSCGSSRGREQFKTWTVSPPSTQPTKLVLVINRALVINVPLFIILSHYPNSVKDMHRLICPDCNGNMMTLTAPWWLQGPEVIQPVNRQIGSCWTLSAVLIDVFKWIHKFMKLRTFALCRIKPFFPLTPSEQTGHQSHSVFLDSLTCILKSH